MYFGDEDPALIADKCKTLSSNLPSEIQLSQPKPCPEATVTPTRGSREDDQVLLFNEESGSFEYSSGGDASGGPVVEGGEGSDGLAGEAGKVSRGRGRN